MKLGERAPVVLRVLLGFIDRADLGGQSRSLFLSVFSVLVDVHRLSVRVVYRSYHDSFIRLGIVLADNDAEPSTLVVIRPEENGLPFVLAEFPAEAAVCQNPGDSFVRHVVFRETGTYTGIDFDLDVRFARSAREASTTS